jgi:thiaminase (transcriptional activator TenA)
MEQAKTAITAQALWDEAADVIAATEKHPFLVAMVDGTLAMDQFKYYVVQDALYLADFAAALRLLSRNPGISSHDSVRLEQFAKGAEEAEMALHNSFFKEWAISSDGVDQMPNCLLYTSYMLRVVATRPHAEGLAVLLPCFWVYMHVGQAMLKLRQELGDS